MGSFVIVQSARRATAWARLWLRARVLLARGSLASAVVVSTRHAQQCAGLHNSKLRCKVLNSLERYCSSFCVVGMLAPSSAATFFGRR